MYQNAIEEGKKTFGIHPRFILCIKPDTQVGLYAEIKKASDSFFGVVSQCMIAKHLRKCSPQYIANILLKVNAKLGGRNSVLAGANPLPKVADVPTIVFGADVTHPGAMERAQPSIAAVTASMDRHCAKHFGLLRKQGARQEIIEDLETCARQLLLKFYKETSCKPQRLIFYRDGVSEGQFQDVLRYEVNALSRAFESLEPGYRPTITFVVVKKRHHTRFFPMSHQDGDRSGNIRAGTVVEGGVCHPHQFDFFLTSHAGIQGTSRPSYYHVILDENAFTSDELQQLTFNLCHNYVRCTKAVSIVPAVYYAHLLAFRARHLLDFNGSDTMSVSSGGSAKSSDVNMHEINVQLENTMFFV